MCNPEKSHLRKFMDQRKSRLLIVITDFNTSFWYRNKDLLKQDFETFFLQIVKKGEYYHRIPDDIAVGVMPLKWNTTLKKLFNFIYAFWFKFKMINLNKCDLVCMNIMPDYEDLFLFLYRLFFPFQKFYLTLCTPLGNKKFIKTVFSYNLKCFRYIGGDSPMLRKELGLNNRFLYNGSLGYIDSYGFMIREFKEMHLVYIGVNRELWKTVKGFSSFARKNPEVICSYDIIGSGRPHEIKMLESEIDLCSDCCSVRYHGFLPLEEIKAIFRKSNVGISFVPMIKMYENVSVTKTVEYLLCGMPVIATRVSFNNELICDVSGVLCDDSSESFADALQTFWNNRNRFDSADIRSRYEYLLSENVIRNSLIPDLKKILDI